MSADTPVNPTTIWMIVVFAVYQLPYLFDRALGVGLGAETLVRIPYFVDPGVETLVQTPFVDGLGAEALIQPPFADGPGAEALIQTPFADGRRCECRVAV